MFPAKDAAERFTPIGTDLIVDLGEGNRKRIPLLLRNQIKRIDGPE